jgi:hypothetical protein
MIASQVMMLSIQMLRLAYIIQLAIAYIQFYKSLH